MHAGELATILVVLGAGVLTTAALLLIADLKDWRRLHERRAHMRALVDEAIAMGDYPAVPLELRRTGAATGTAGSGLTAAAPFTRHTLTHDGNGTTA